MNTLSKIALGLVAAAGLGFAGTLVPAASFPSYGAHGVVETTPLPAGLPAPVERFYRELYGEQVPVIRSVVITGRASMTIGGVTLPARLRFTHEAGKHYRHYFEVTYFGLPVMRVNERYLDGHELMELPFGAFEGPNYDQAGNLGMWGELLAWAPAALLTDPRVRWEAVDDTTAWLVVPFAEGEDRFLLRFDPQSGLLALAEAMRYKDDRPQKTLWLNQGLGYDKVSGYLVSTAGAAIWQDDGRPWATFRAEEVIYNTDVSQYVRGRGL
jgi:hypothetical protein